jgi:endonuclease/exonuclease/phosphatase family metal-dependent hydrolase
MMPVSLQAPQGKVWARMSDHLPLIAEFELSLDPL